MSDDRTPAPAVHEDPELFAEAINYTSAATDFSARLIERDYFVSLLLHHICGRARGVVFKGGTCLSKVYWEFSRLSEDLDLAVPVPLDVTRRQRRKALDPVKKALAAIQDELQTFQVEQPLRGFNVSTQYVSVFSYRSHLTADLERIRVETSFREPLLMESVMAEARTLLLDPVTGERTISDFAVRTIAEAEAYAERARAALTRREPAVRDFYDFDHAGEIGRLDANADDFVALVRRKLAVPGNEQVDLSEERREQLQRQVHSELRPVLRPVDFEAFDFERAFSAVAALARRLE